MEFSETWGNSTQFLCLISVSVIRARRKFIGTLKFYVQLFYPNHQATTKKEDLLNGTLFQFSNFNPTFSFQVDRTDRCVGTTGFEQKVDKATDFYMSKLLLELFWKSHFVHFGEDLQAKEFSSSLKLESFWFL